jgi:hypothetical protein
VASGVVIDKAAVGRVSAIFLSAVAFNMLSDQFEISAPLVMVLALAALLVLLVVESAPRSPQGGSDGKPLLSQASKNLLVFSLSSLLLGVLVGGAWVLPIWESREIHPPPELGLTFFHNYELGAALVITALGCVAAARGRPPVDLLIFLTSAVTGMTLAIVSLQPTNEFLTTFLAWLLVAIMLTLAVAMMPEVFRLFRVFWGSSSDGASRSLFVDLREDDVPTERSLDIDNPSNQ